MAIYRLMDGGTGRPGNGPSAANASSGNYLAGTLFEVTQSGLWMTGYWWWCCNTGQQTTAVDFALWQITSSSAGVFVTGSHVTSGTLTAGAWNYTALSTPLALSVNVPYLTEVGYVDTTGFPLTQNQFGASQPFAAGITNGPLFAFGSSNPTSFAQGSFSSVNGADPTAGIANSAQNNGNFWVDVQVTDVPPPGTSYRLFPNVPSPLTQTPDTANNFTLAAEFSLAQACQLNKIWFYSGPATTTQLPTEAGVWQISNQSLLASTHVVSPTWSGAAGSGWVSTTIPGQPLLQPSVRYKVSVFNGAVTPVTWNVTRIQYWNVFEGINGVSTGPLFAPNEGAASAPGNGSYHQGATFSWPDTYDAAGTGDNYWVDLEVTPVVTQPLSVAHFRST